jgi:hypothetical protein
MVLSDGIEGISVSAPSENEILYFGSALLGLPNNLGKGLEMIDLHGKVEREYMLRNEILAA